VRNLFILILIGIALAVVRWLVTDVVRAVKKAVASPDGDASPSAEARKAAGDSEAGKSGHLVRDPVSGIYVDEQVAIQAEINGKTFFFESRHNRDEYVKKARAGQV
jgi:YHS domain-containing protein